MSALDLFFFKFFRKRNITHEFFTIVILLYAHNKILTRRSCKKNKETDRDYSYKKKGTQRDVLNTFKFSVVNQPKLTNLLSMDFL
jgi:hypothetical protein